MKWNKLDNTDILDKIDADSADQTVMIFKHSTSCPISSMALNRLERKWKDNFVQPYLLDLLRFRELSNSVAQRYSVTHESPQVLLVKSGKVVYHTSHMGINFDDIKEKSAD